MANYDAKQFKQIICLNTDTFDPKICVKWMFLTIALLLKAINKKTA